MLQIKVLHLHSVPCSLAPDGPSDLGHIKKDLPQFTPFFFVNIVTHGSLCSQCGTTLGVRIFDQDSFAAIGSMNSLGDSEEPVGFEGEALEGVEGVGEALSVRLRLVVDG